MPMNEPEGAAVRISWVVPCVEPELSPRRMVVAVAGFDGRRFQASDPHGAEYLSFKPPGRILESPQKREDLWAFGELVAFQRRGWFPADYTCELTHVIDDEVCSNASTTSTLVGTSGQGAHCSVYKTLLKDCNGHFVPVDQHQEGQYVRGVLGLVRIKSKKVVSVVDHDMVEIAAGSACLRTTGSHRFVLMHHDRNG